MYANNAWHSDGLRWLASLLNDLASFLDRMDSAPGGRAAVCASDACDEARSRVRYRIPYY